MVGGLPPPQRSFILATYHSVPAIILGPPKFTRLYFKAFLLSLTESGLTFLSSLPVSAFDLESLIHSHVMPLSIDLGFIWAFCFFVFHLSHSHLTALESEPLPLAVCAVVFLR